MYKVKCKCGHQWFGLGKKQDQFCLCCMESVKWGKKVKILMLITLVCAFVFVILNIL